MKKIISYIENKKEFYIKLLSIVGGILLILGIFFGYQWYIQDQNEKRLEHLSYIFDDYNLDYDHCSDVLDYKIENITATGGLFGIQHFNRILENCNREYSIDNINFDEYSCLPFIRKTDEYFEERYINIENLETKRQYCYNTFFKVKISQGKLYDVFNDFKSEIIIDFGATSFYQDQGQPESQEFMNNRIAAKKRFLKLLKTSENISVGIENLILYPKKAILILPLEPKQKYIFNIKSFNISEKDLPKRKSTYSGEIKWKKETPFVIERKDFLITMPENKYLGIIMNNPVTLYQDNRSPQLQLLSYNSGKTETAVKICRIPNESYAQIEVLTARKNKDFYKKGIDDIETFECFNKKLTLNKNDKEILIKQKFNFDDLIGTPARSGLYYVTFEKSSDRVTNGNYQTPLFFGIVDSHITMKLSKNGQAFFFVNDFLGKPLANQNIRLYVNNYQDKSRKYNRTTRKYDYTYYSPLDNPVLGEAEYLGKTNEEGILEVNLSDKVGDLYDRTFENWWEEQENGKYRSIFITSASENNISYVNSRWNAGIAPWNFGYSIGSNYWYGNDKKGGIQAQRYIKNELKYYSHTYPDRTLYLPGEEVYVKSIIRNSSDLSIPKGKKIEIKIKDSKKKEVYSEFINISEYGSISSKFILSKEATLGSYTIEINIDEKNIGRSGFTVEVFKNPKFKNDISLKTLGLNEGFIDITETEEKSQYGWMRKTYKGKFQIKGNIVSKYYNGAMVGGAPYTYKVYKQYYYGNDYWDDCYYGCYWEPRKEFYTQGKGVLDENGMSDFLVDIAFSTNYSDYKYIVEVTVKDTAGDYISGTNSTVVMLPEKYKSYNWDSKLIFKEKTRFIKTGEKAQIIGGLNVGKWTNSYDNSSLMIIKKKDYLVEYIEDIRGKRPKNIVKETIVDMLYINDSNFEKNNEGKLILNYKLPESGEYIFEYVNLGVNYSLERKFRKFSKNKNKSNNNNISTELLKEIIEQFIKEKKNTIIFTYEGKEITIYLNDIFNGTKNFLSIVAYGKESAKNPEKHDNKVQVLSEKISYKLGEKARVLVRLPYENAKILWTIEKQGVISHEYEDIQGNISFKEFIIDETFMPNAYISAVIIDTRTDVIPEYKVGYTEIVVDKTEKKTDISVLIDKKKYAPRETVKLDILVVDQNKKAVQSELTVMVVDDSLISLLGNVDLNTLEKFYKKLPFQIQTQITLIAMLKNYYFSRAGIVGGSGEGSFKGGDSAISTRNIFKNTAFYNPNIITDTKGNAHVEFTLPDNLTNFRVMVISNSKQNYFGYSESFIEVRKNVLIEDKTPLMLRTRDNIQVGANIFNITDTNQDFEVIFTAKGVEVENKSQKISIDAGKKQFITWNIVNISNPDILKYSITAKGKSAYLSDKIEKEIPIYASPVLITRHRKSGIIPAGGKYKTKFKLPENIDIENSKVELIFSNNRLYGIEKTVQSLLKYPYGCIEQTISSTYPNAVLKKFNRLLAGVVKADEVDSNLKAGIKRIASMQTADGGFGYWIGDRESNLTITPYVLRSLLEMKEMGVNIDQAIIQKTIKYLQRNIDKVIDDTQKVELFWALALAKKPIKIKIDKSKLSRHDLLAYTYGLYHVDKIKNAGKIRENIIRIQEKIKTEKSYSYYWNATTDTAILAQLMLDINYGNFETDKIITDLYEMDFSSYYYSTKTKNAAFRAFAKYIENIGNKKNNIFDFSIENINDKDNSFIGASEYVALIKNKYSLKDILHGDTIDLDVINKEGDQMYVDFILYETPLNKEKIPEMKNGISVKRTISKVLQEGKISECRYRYWNNTQDNCENIFEETKNIFEKGTLYKAEIIVKIDGNKKNTDLVIEDYLPSGFEVVQSKFKTESIAVGQAGNNQWNWDHIENKPNVVMAHAKYVYRNEIRYEYYFRPKFIGTFTQPPVTAYFMYSPDIRAHTKFNSVEVK